MYGQHLDCLPQHSTTRLAWSLGGCKTNPSLRLIIMACCGAMVGIAHLRPLDANSTHGNARPC